MTLIKIDGRDFNAIPNQEQWEQTDMFIVYLQINMKYTT